MIQRRFVNLVFDCMRSRMHSLHRLDVAKHLFYPSTAEAEAANAKESNNGGGGGGKTKPPRIKRLRRLPEPSMRFFQFPFPDADEEEPDSWPSMGDAFMLLSPGTSEATILHATEEGRAVIYDADARAASAAVPCFPEPMGRDPISFSVPGSGRFMDDGFFFDEKESLYVMRSGIKKQQGGGCSGDFVVVDFNQPFRWQRLPPPPFPAGYYSDDIGVRITSSAVVDGGRTICVSSEGKKGAAESTYCFDTAARRWRHAGDWALPFDGRAEYVPELETWIGLSPYPRCNLCASDLSSAMDDDAHQQAPTLQHVWDDFTPPPKKTSSVVLNRRFPQFVLRRWKQWSGPRGRHLVNLGSGRFCVFKVFEINRGEQVRSHVDDDVLAGEIFAVLIGVEVVRGGEGELRMVKHKAKRCPSLPGFDAWVF